MTRSPPLAPAAWRFLVPALMIPLLLALTLLWLQSEYARWETLRVDARASYFRRSDVIELLSVMRSAETSQRGYAISGDQPLRARYVEAEAQTRQLLRNLQPAFRDDAVQERQLALLNRTVDAKFAEMDEVVYLHDRQGPEAARARISDGEGQRLMAQFERTAGEIIRREVATGEQRASVFTARAASIQWTMWLIVALGSVALGVLLLLLWRQRREQFQSALAGYEAAERNQAILNGTADPILIVNPSGTIETVNAAVTRVLGYRPEDVARRDVSIVADIAPGTGSFHERIGLVDGVLRTSFLHEHPVRDQLGKVVPYDIALGSMRLPDGDHVVMSLRDITERRRLDRLKDDLISTVSHELRTPLTSIVGALSLLNAEVAGKLPADAKDLVRIAGNNGQRLIRLINDMLDIDRIDAGKFRLAIAPTDLRDVIQRACEDNRVLAETHGATLDCAVPDEPLMVVADNDRIQQVVVNLLSNAVKFSPDTGTVRVAVRRDPAGRRAIVEVDDEGAGIPEEFRARIFGRFERSADSDGAAGTGLGLAIAREIVTRHGGEIWFEDRPGGGTRFAFALPVAVPPTVASDIREDAKILICERDAAMGRSLQTLLAHEGYASRVVTTADVARDAIAQNGYTMLLVDMALDDGNAFELARDVRGQAGPDTLSILLVSPMAAGAPGQFSLDLVDWIDKPIDAARLRAAVAAAIRGSAAAPPTILHLDDDQDTLDITAAALADEVRILKARSLAEARELLAHETPQLAILDYHLEKGTGLDLLQDLVTRQGISIPTIIYSAQDVRFESNQPVDAVLLKSRTSLPDLKATIRRVISVRHGEDAA